MLMLHAYFDETRHGDDANTKLRMAEHSHSFNLFAERSRTIRVNSCANSFARPIGGKSWHNFSDGPLLITQLLRRSHQHPCDLPGRGQSYRRWTSAFRAPAPLALQQVRQQTNATTLQIIARLSPLWDRGVKTLNWALPLLPELALEQLLQRLAQVIEQMPTGRQR